MNNIVKIANHQSKALEIGSIMVKQDTEGRYCLNDVHKAAGGEERHKPAHWSSNDSTQNLVELLKVENPTFNPLNATAGRGGGTYVARELVYCYAMWISSEFHLKVIRAYDQLLTHGVVIHESAAQYFMDNPDKYMQQITEQAEALLLENAQLKQIVSENISKAEYYDAVKGSANCQTMEEVAKKFGVGHYKLFRLLREKKVLRNVIGNLPYQKYLDYDYFIVEGKSRKQYGQTLTYNRVMVTGKGELYIGSLLREAGWLSDKLAA
ncbi:KilA-N domain-containing protein [Pseudomonas sp. UM16]|uniref:KilA-N domain-containing protein n=1 Tax=Pseudomonas sp. UM16 TaxID=3158962 RepID=UPI00398F9CFE